VGERYGSLVLLYHYPKNTLLGRIYHTKPRLLKVCASHPEVGTRFLDLTEGGNHQGESFREQRGKLFKGGDGRGLKKKYWASKRWESEVFLKRRTPRKGL